MDELLMLADLSRICRFCLKNVSEEDEIRINSVTLKQFKTLTNIELNISDSYSNISCKKCCCDIRKSAIVKVKLIKNQKRLEQFLENCHEDPNKTIQIKEELYFDFKQGNEESIVKEEFQLLDMNLGIQQNVDVVPYPNPVNYCEDLEQYQKYTHVEILDENLLNDCVSKTKIAKSDNIEHLPEVSVNQQKRIKNLNHYKGKERVVCEDCGNYFTKTSLKNHRLRKHSNETPKYECDLCSKKFFRKGELKDHMTIHTGVKELACNLCGKLYGTRNALNMHINKFHLHKWQVYCEYCGKHFTNRGNYVGHIRSNHTGEKPFVCNECNKAFYNNGDLKKHKLHVHSTEPQTCDVCLKIFRSIISLRRHKKIHVAVRERKHECTYENCSKKFLTNALLLQHQKVHLGKKDFQCLLCGIEYYKNAELKRHIRSIHMKIKLKCELPGCKSQFARKETYRNHILSHHKSIGEANIQIMLKNIRDLQLPEPELNINFGGD